MLGCNQMGWKCPVGVGLLGFRGPFASGRKNSEAIAANLPGGPFPELCLDDRVGPVRLTRSKVHHAQGARNKIGKLQPGCVALLVSHDQAKGID